MGVIFSVYRYFRDPQIKSDKTDALMEQRFQWGQENVDKRFKDFQDSFSLLVSTSQNHLHTLDTKIEALTVVSVQMQKDVVRLMTIIEERIPTKGKRKE